MNKFIRHALRIFQLDLECNAIIKILSSTLKDEMLASKWFNEWQLSQFFTQAPNPSKKNWPDFLTKQVNILKP